MPQILVSESDEPEEAGEKQACPKCDAGLDAQGHHMVCCKLNGFTMRHHVVVEALAGIARSAGYPCKKEVALPDESKDQKGQLLRPADVLISRFDEHGPLAVDVTVKDPLKNSGPARPEDMGSWYDKEEQKKCAKYVIHTNRAKWQFKPFVMDVWGGMGQDAQSVVAHLLKGILCQREAWQRRQAEHLVWQTCSKSAVPGKVDECAEI